MQNKIRVALAGNPNCGKTTLFNALTGNNQYVGNWPGVTVEKKEGKLKKDSNVIVVDLPGIYSLSPYTLEEVVARNYLIGERPDVILNLVDGTNIERNLYLTTQLCEIGIPVVIAINMIDLVKKRGDKINLEGLSKKIGCPVVEISALKLTGIQEAADAAIEAAKKKNIITEHYFSGEVEHVLAHIEEAAIHDFPPEQQRWYAIKIFERDKKVIEQLKLDQNIIEHIETDIVGVEKKFDDDSESIITNERYDYVAAVLKDNYKKKNKGKMTTSDKIDRILTNRILALPIFALIMFGVYAISIGTVGSWTVDFMNETLFGEWIVPWVTQTLTGWGVMPWLTSLISDGIIGGVGAVLGFVPQMFILFFLLSILEDVGYMSRVAFIMDKIFRKFGMSGKSFIPMLVASGCGVPGIMASRTIEQDRDRKMTIMTTCFIPCGAKMPIIGLIASALFGNSALIATVAYFIGIAAVIISATLLKKTKLFAGDPAPFVMELPEYHIPSPTNILRATWERGWGFIKKAGTVILAASVIIWILNSISFDGGFHYIGGGADGRSVLQVLGSAIDFLFAPLGFGKWEAVVATLLGLLAKEEVVGVFGTLAEMAGLSTDEMVFAFFDGSKLAAFSFMMFNLLCAPCFAAMGAIKREKNNAKWTAAAIGYMCAFAYAVCLIVYQIGNAIMGNINIIGLISALIVLAGLLYLVFRKNKYEKIG